MTTKTSFNVTELLDFTAPSSEQNVVNFSQFVEVPTSTSLPRSTLDLVPIEFRIEKSAPYLDLRETYIYTRFKVKRKDGTALQDNEVVTTCNNFGYAMWNNLEISLGGQRVTENQTLYPWMSYIHCLTKLSAKYRNTALRTSLWYEDIAGLMDSNDFSDPDVPVNEGAVKRNAKIRKSDIVETYTRILPDFGIMKKLLPSFTDILIRFRPSDPSLCLIAGQNDAINPLTVEIQDAKLYTTRVFLTPQADNYYERLLSSKGFRYDLQRYVTRTKIVNTGEQNLEWTPVLGRLPRRLYIFQLLQSSFHCNIKKNPFNLQSFGVKNMQVFVNERPLPTNVPAVMGTEEKARLYINSLHTFDKFAITLDQFIAGYFIIAVDLTADQSAKASYLSTEKQGAVRINITYEKPQTEAIVVFCTYEEDVTLHLDKNRNPTWIHKA